MADDRSEHGGSSNGGPPHPPGPTPNWLTLAALGTACALCIIVAGGLGYLVDSWLGTTPWLTFAGLLFGIVSAILLAVARLRPYL